MKALNNCVKFDFNGENLDELKNLKLSDFLKKELKTFDDSFKLPINRYVRRDEIKNNMENNEYFFNFYDNGFLIGDKVKFSNGIPNKDCMWIETTFLHSFNFQKNYPCKEVAENKSMRNVEGEDDEWLKSIVSTVKTYADKIYSMEKKMHLDNLLNFYQNHSVRGHKYTVFFDKEDYDKTLFDLYKRKDECIQKENDRIKNYKKEVGNIFIDLRDLMIEREVVITQLKSVETNQIILDKIRVAKYGDDVYINVKEIKQDWSYQLILAKLEIDFDFNKNFDNLIKFMVMKNPQYVKELI